MLRWWVPICLNAVMSSDPSTSPDANEAGAQSTCFVVMGFGKKNDFETGRVLDLDQSYHNLIKPAVEAAGLRCIRADEIVHSGLIDVPMYELLLKADVVVADLSTSNRNAIYELGVRHALRPYTTVIIAEDKVMKSPFFDLSHIVIRQYEHLGKDIGFSEARRFGGELTKAIRDIMAMDPASRADSPVYKFLEGLTPPAVAKVVKAAVAAASPEVAQVRAPSPPAHSELMARVEQAQNKGDWRKARILLEEIREMRKAAMPNESSGGSTAPQEDPDILQRLALATYKSNDPNPGEALKQARDLLKLLDPQISNDTETLGLWGSVHKRLWDLTNQTPDLDQAIRGYERGFYLRNDYYNGINYAFLLNVRAAHSANVAEAVADYVQARRVRQEVISICEQWLKENTREDGKERSAKFKENRYWVLATIAEAHIGLEDGKGEQALAEAFAAATADWMRETTEKQVKTLKELLANSPLKKLPGAVTQS
jgi:hypothetical protein